MACRFFGRLLRFLVSALAWLVLCEGAMSKAWACMRLPHHPRPVSCSPAIRRCQSSWESTSDGEDLSRRFRRWTEASGVRISSKVDLRVIHPSGRERGAFASSPIRASEYLVERLPSSSVLSETKAAAAEHDAPCRELGPLWKRWTARPIARLAVRLLWAQREFQPYWSLLPEREAATAPWAWGPNALKLLPSKLSANIREDAARVASSCAELQAFQTEHPGVFSTRLSNTSFEKALFAAQSRAFSTQIRRETVDMFALQSSVVVAGMAFGSMHVAGAGATLAFLLGLLCTIGLVWLVAISQPRTAPEISLLPWIDLVNHSGRAHLGGEQVRFDPMRGEFSYTAPQAFSRGDQIFHSYGRKSNDELLRQYGFVEADNVHDFFDLALGDPACKFAIPARVRTETERVLRGAVLRFGRGGIILDTGAAAQRLALPLPGKHLESCGLTRPLVAQLLQKFAARKPFGETAAADDALLRSLRASRPARQVLCSWRAERRRLLGEAVARWS